MTELTIVVTYRNNSVYVDNLLLSLRRLEHFSSFVSEVIIVDSNSDTPYISSFSDCPLRIILNHQGTLSSSLNIGIEQVSTRWVAIFDADTEICDTHLLNLPRLCPNSSILLPVSCYPSGEPQDCFDSLDTTLYGYVLTKSLCGKLLGRYTRNKRRLSNGTSPFKVNYFWNQCVFVNLDKTPNFRYCEKIHVYGCDFELSKRLAKQGIFAECHPSYRVIHYGAGSDGGHTSFKRMLLVLFSEFSYVNEAYPSFSLVFHSLAIAIKLALLLASLTSCPSRAKLPLRVRLLRQHVLLLLRSVLHPLQLCFSKDCLTSLF
jgi:glycosyltransferase involved in cell wall biosynthesis